MTLAEFPELAAQVPDRLHSAEVTNDPSDRIRFKKDELTHWLAKNVNLNDLWVANEGKEGDVFGTESLERFYMGMGYSVDGMIEVFGEIWDREEKMTELEALQKSYAALQQDNADYDASFELRHAADMRAIARWREAHPGKELVMPDHADLCVWLLEQLEVKP